MSGNQFGLLVFVIVAAGILNMAVTCVLVVMWGQAILKRGK